MKHKDQYNDPRWIVKREEILEDRNHTCEDCQSTDCTLQVHHGYYELGKMMWEYDNDTLWCLCIECHENWGEMKRMLQEEMAKISMKNLQQIDFLLGLFGKMGKKSKTFTPLFNKR